MNTERAILIVLDQIGERLQPEELILTELNLTLRDPVTARELLAALNEVDRKGQAIGVRGEDRKVRWKITDEGRARLAGGRA